MSTLFADTIERQQKQVLLFESMAKQASGVPVGQIATSGIMPVTSIGDASQRMRKEAYAWNRGWVFSCVQAIATKVASAPVMAGELAGAPENTPREAGFWRKAGEPVKRPDGMGPRLAQKAVIDQDLELFAHHPVLDVLCRPNPIMTKFEFLYFSTANLELTGECYWVGGVVNEGGEDRVEVWPVPTKWIRPIHEGNLFTGYILQSNTMTEGVRLEPENVARIYFADPADPKSSMTPLRAIMPAVRTDDALQRSQQILMERGINPNVIVTLGKIQQGMSGQMRRPRLSKAHRRQMIRAVRELLSSSLNAGDPVILDDFIESVHKLHYSPQEMDYLQSGKVTKDRILQAFRVHPILLGQMENANRAQAAEARRITADMAINPVIDAFSEAATDFLGPMYEDPDRLLVWFERWIPSDPELELKQWMEANKYNRVTEDEFRNYMGLPPAEKPAHGQLFNTGPGFQFVTQMMTLLTTGRLERDTVKKLLVEAGLDAKRAEDLFDFEQPEPPPPPVIQAPPEPEEALDEDAEDLPEQRSKSFETKNLVQFLKQPKPAKSPIKVKDLQKIHVKQVGKTEQAVARHLADHFRRIISDTTRAIRKLDVSLLPEEPSQRAKSIMEKVFDLDEARDDLLETAAQLLPAVFAHGAFAELEIHRSILDPTKQTTAQEMAIQLEIDEENLPFSLGPMPEWLLEAAREELEVSFQQDYWQRIGETTRDDIQRTAQQGVERGFSMRRLAREIAERHGAQYSLQRAMLVARTEVPDILNAGHAAGMVRLEEESGLRIGKVWVSAFQTFTRASHAANDGQTTDSATGMFDLNGQQIPWPAYYSLPASDRCNCLCTHISEIIMDQLS